VSALAIIIIVVVAVVLLLIVGGLVASGRLFRDEDAHLRATAQEADRALAAARAVDRGWDRPALEASAREAFAARSPAEVRELLLIQVVDRPGTEEDQARFRVIDEHGEHDVLLGRRGDDWVQLAG
jgi:hypothetical protein